jgi:hypothetical protein
LVNQLEIVVEFVDDKDAKEDLDVSQNFSVENSIVHYYVNCDKSVYRNLDNIKVEPS